MLIFWRFLDCIWANFNLYLWFLGFVRSLYPQHGQKKPSHLTKILHIWHRFWPAAYLPTPIGLIALCLRQIPLHVITNIFPYSVFFVLLALSQSFPALRSFLLSYSRFRPCVTSSNLYNAYHYSLPRARIANKIYEIFYLIYSIVCLSVQIFDLYIIFFSNTHWSFRTCFWSSKPATSVSTPIVTMKSFQFNPENQLITDNNDVYFNLWCCPGR